MPSYHALGKIPPKRHTQFRKPDGGLYSEELFGEEGFSGVESLLYHQYPPTRVSKIERFGAACEEEWKQETHRHHHLKAGNSPPGGDPISGRKTLMYNADCAISAVAPDRADGLLLPQRHGRRAALRPLRLRARLRRPSAHCPTARATTC